MRKLLTVLTRSAGVLAGSAALIVAIPAAAQAADGTWSTSGQAGVHAQGTWKTENSKIYFEGYVRDTACDGKNTSMTINFARWHWQFPEPYRNETVKNTSGCNTNQHFSFNSYQPGKTVDITVKECVGDDCSHAARVVRTDV